MTKKLTQKAFNEEMFDVIYTLNLSETITINPIIESALDTLRKQGYDVPDFVAGGSWGPSGDNFNEIPKLKKLFDRFEKRFYKLTGYE